ncbi:Uncharacterised protein [uncultured archaeon]|nr:Uncharacterised protein [uncultured archaeon]
MDILIANIFGWVGLFLLLLDYFLLATKKIASSSFIYSFINFMGGVFIIINSFVFKIWPVFVLNIFWASIGLFGMFKSTKKGVKKK